MSLKSTFEAVAAASRELGLVEESKINQLLTELAKAAIENTENILEENKKDLARMRETDPKYDRPRYIATRRLVTTCGVNA